MPGSQRRRAVMRPSKGIDGLYKELRNQQTIYNQTQEVRLLQTLDGEECAINSFASPLNRLQGNVVFVLQLVVAATMRISTVRLLSQTNRAVDRQIERKLADSGSWQIHRLNRSFSNAQSSACSTGERSVMTSSAARCKHQDSRAVLKIHHESAKLETMYNVCMFVVPFPTDFFALADEASEWRVECCCSAWANRR
jgi:site-specific recombinase